MSLAVPDHFTTQFGKNFEPLVAQTVSRLRKFAVVTTGCTGEAKTHNQVDSIAAKETTGTRYNRLAQKDLDTEKRWNHMRTFQGLTSEPKWDEIALAPTIMGQGTHIVQHSAAYARQLDAVLINGLLGTNYTGATGSTTQAITQSVAVDFVASGSPANSGMTASKVIEAVRQLRASEAWNSEAQARGVKLCGLLNSELEAQLLHAANTNAGDRLYSKEFLPPVYDENGGLRFWLGVNWVSIEALPTNTGGTIAESAIWTSDGLYLDIWQDLKVYVDILPELDHCVQFKSDYAFNACRRQEKQVVKINCVL
jgi:hypothetical protein